MDNHPVHHAKIVQNFLKENNINFLFLPPYSPNLNPIEEAFSKVKSILRNEKARTEQELVSAITRACKMITPENAFGYFKHAYEYLY